MADPILVYRSEEEIKAAEKEKEAEVSELLQLISAEGDIF